MTANSIPESYTESEVSNPEEIPHHIRNVNVRQEEFNMMVNHTEAPFQIRKHLID